MKMVYVVIMNGFFIEGVFTTKKAAKAWISAEGKGGIAFRRISEVALDRVREMK